MYIINNTYISDDIADTFFVCDLASCHGACCVEGDGGAPLDMAELSILDDILPKIFGSLSQEGKEVIAAQGAYIQDEWGGYTTPLVRGKECAYAVYDEKGTLCCGIEKAKQAGEIDFLKPISCHLYPIRISNLANGDAINYHRWQICNCAIKKGKQEKVALYQFLEVPLVRKYGQDWYNELVRQIRVSNKEE